MESPRYILLMNITSSWRNQIKSMEERVADMNKLKRREKFRTREDNDKVAKLMMGSQVDKCELCSRVMLHWVVSREKLIK